MILKLTNTSGKKFLLNSDYIFEVEEKKDPDKNFNSIIRLVNQRECLVKETMNVIYKKTRELDGITNQQPDA
jgi:uncharacterized protein YlzI (FlbEa/FlbD family)